MDLEVQRQHLIGQRDELQPVVIENTGTEACARSLQTSHLSRTMYPGVDPQAEMNAPSVDIAM